MYLHFTTQAARLPINLDYRAFVFMHRGLIRKKRNKLRSSSGLSDQVRKFNVKYHSIYCLVLVFCNELDILTRWSFLMVSLDS